jgi:hypothetical protein
VKRMMRRLLLTVLAALPIPSVSFAASIAKGKERNDLSTEKPKGDEGGERSEPESNASDR